MVYDYLGLGDTGITRQPKAKKLSRKDDGYLNMSSDYLGLGEFARQNTRDVGKARRYVKGQIKEYKTTAQEIRREAHEFRQDVGRGGWIGDYLRRKIGNKPKPKKFVNSKF